MCSYECVKLHKIFIAGMLISFFCKIEYHFEKSIYFAIIEFGLHSLSNAIISKVS